MVFDINSILAPIGGIAVIGGIVGFIAHWIAKSLFQKEITKESNKLEQFRQTLSHQLSNKEKYSDLRLKLYNELWYTLVELKFKGDDLWVKVTKKSLLDFSKNLLAAKISIEKKRLLLTDVDYQKLMEVMLGFEKYKFGKFEILKINSNNYDTAMEGVNAHMNQASVNYQIKLNYEKLLASLQSKFRKQIYSDFNS